MDSTGERASYLRVVSWGYLVVGSLMGLLTVVRPTGSVALSRWLAHPVAAFSLAAGLLATGMLLLGAGRGRASGRKVLLARLSWSILAGLVALIVATPPSCTVAVANGIGIPQPPATCETLLGVTLTPKAARLGWVTVLRVAVPVAAAGLVFVVLSTLWRPSIPRVAARIAPARE